MNIVLPAKDNDSLTTEEALNACYTDKWHDDAREYAIKLKIKMTPMIIT